MLYAIENKYEFTQHPRRTRLYAIENTYINYAIYLRACYSTDLADFHELHQQRWGRCIPGFLQHYTCNHYQAYNMADCAIIRVPTCTYVYLRVPTCTYVYLRVPTWLREIRSKYLSFVCLLSHTTFPPYTVSFQKKKKGYQRNSERRLGGDGACPRRSLAQRSCWARGARARG